MTNKDTLEVTKTLFMPTPVSQVWRFLMNEEKMKAWLNAYEFVIDMSDGGKIEFPLTFGDQEYLIIGEFSILLLEKKYAFVWRERDPFGDEWFNCTTVSFDLEEKENGTLLKLVHNGFQYLPTEIRHQIQQRYVDFWVRGDILDRFAALVIAE